MTDKRVAVPVGNGVLWLRHLTLDEIHSTTRWCSHLIAGYLAGDPDAVKYATAINANLRVHDPADPAHVELLHGAISALEFSTLAAVGFQREPGVVTTPSREQLVAWLDDEIARERICIMLAAIIRETKRSGDTVTNR